MRLEPCGVVGEAACERPFRLIAEVAPRRRAANTRHSKCCRREARMVLARRAPVQSRQVPSAAPPANGHPKDDASCHPVAAGIAVTRSRNTAISGAMSDADFLQGKVPCLEQMQLGGRHIFQVRLSPGLQKEGIVTRPRGRAAVAADGAATPATSDTAPDSCGSRARGRAESACDQASRGSAGRSVQPSGAIRSSLLTPCRYWPFVASSGRSSCTFAAAPSTPWPNAMNCRAMGLRPSS